MPGTWMTSPPSPRQPQGVWWGQVQSLVAHTGVMPGPSVYGGRQDHADSLPWATSEGSRLRELPWATRLGMEPWTLLRCLQGLNLFLSLSYSKVGLCYPRYLPHFPWTKADSRQKQTCAWRCLKWDMQGIYNKQKYTSCNHSQTLRWEEGFREWKFKGFHNYSSCIRQYDISAFPVKGKLTVTDVL